MTTQELFQVCKQCWCTCPNLGVILRSRKTIIEKVLWIGILPKPAPNIDRRKVHTGQALVVFEDACLPVTDFIFKHDEEGNVIDVKLEWEYCDDCIIDCAEAICLDLLKLLQQIKSKG